MIKELFSGQDGEWSSKRVYSFICLVTSIIFGFMNKPIEYIAAFLSACLLLQGVSALQESALAGKLNDNQPLT